MSLVWFPFTQHAFFKGLPHFGWDWLVIFVLALIPVSVVEITKIIRNWTRGSTNVSVT
jgi:hypothetical protein